MQSPVLERLVGGAVLGGLLLLLALAIGPREGGRMPHPGAPESPPAENAPQLAGSAAAGGSGGVSPPRWVPPPSAPAAGPETVAPARRPLPGSAAGGVSAARAQADLPPPARAGGEAQGAPEAAALPPSAPAPQWAVQVGSFAGRANAERLSGWCRDQGYGVKVEPLRQGSGTLYRVRVGPYPSRAAAGNAAARLGLRGHSGFVAEWDGSSP